MRIIKEFKEFAMRGNVMDMAVGIIIGGAFGKIVTSLVNDVIMPPIGYVLGGVDFGHLQFVIKPAVDNTPAVSVKYGSFINTIIDFLIVAFVIFLMIRFINRFHKKEEALASPATPPKEELLLTEIRDLLKANLKK